MNHFFALSLPIPVQQYIASHVMAPWRNAMGDDFAPQWYLPNDYHITLKFLGDVATTQQANLIAAAAPVAAKTCSFSVRLASPGTFPRDNSRFPRVFWMGVAASEPLTVLASDLDEALFDQGCPREMRTYTPHITLVRRKRHDSGRDDAGVVVDEQTFPNWQADALALMRTLSPEEHQNHGGLRYNIVQTFPFQGQTPVR